MSNSEPGWMRRPSPLFRVQDAYGLIIVEESMIPEFWLGNIALVHPHLPPAPGTTCVFFADQDRVTIKHLRRISRDTWHVSQWNPPRDFVLKRSEWRCHPTVGSLSRLEGRQCRGVPVPSH